MPAVPAGADTDRTASYEGIQASERHKSGVAVCFPRILRWRTDKKPEEAGTLDRVKALLNARGER